MLHYWSLNGLHLCDAWVTIGSFDGVHLGHQEIIHRLTAGAHQVGAPAVDLTFYPHPAVVLGKRSQLAYLTAPEDRAEILRGLGVDYAVSHPFNRQIAGTPARDFIQTVHEHLQFKHLWVGHDFALGKNREGNVERLRQLGEEFGFLVEELRPVENGQGVISSSRIRELLAAGDAAGAAHLLGRPYRIPGRVIPGDGRGRTIGIPTANLDVWAGQVVPKGGIYVCRAQVGGQWVGAVTNIGTNPTFTPDNARMRVETHLLDFSDDLYGRTIRLDFLERLRDEERYTSVQALIDQIHKDIAQARGILSRTTR